MTKIVHVKNCFGCSPDNLGGLKVRFKVKDKSLVGEFDSNRNHEGPPGVIHGGVIAAIIDESFATFAVSILKIDARTIRAEIIFRNPARIKDRLSIQTTLKEQKSRTIILEAHVYSGDTVIAEAIGILFKVKKPS